MYGENTRIIREQLAILLRQHRIQHRIGGAGIPTLPTTSTPVERRLIGLQLARYRQAVLVWALQAVRAVDPSPHIPLTERRDRSPATQLQARLVDAVRESGPRPTIEELNTPQRYPMLIAWQTAARAASLGEHDFGPAISFTSLTAAQVRTVLKDAATVTRALLVLDHRYATTPGWRPLTNRGRLSEIAERSIEMADSAGTDVTVDARGWRPKLRPATGPLGPGLAGVLQAHRNLLIALDSVPNTRDLRRIVASQLLTSRTLADLTADDDALFRDTWRERVETYAQLQRWLRDIHGRVGHGAQAASRANAAAELATQLTREDLLHATDVREDLDRLFARLDDRIGRLIERGARERLFSERVPLPGMNNRSSGLIKVQAARYEPLRSSTNAGLVAFVRNELRSTDGKTHAPERSEHSRRQLDAALRLPEAARDRTDRVL